MKTGNIQVTQADPRSDIAATLIAELTAELGARYPDLDDGGGSGAFKADDVTVTRAAFVIVWDGDEALGCGALRPMADSTVGEIKRMYVRQSARGRGISRLILAALENAARDFGYRALLLETGLRQPEAIGLYESAGFKRTDCYGNYTDEPLSVCYEKAL